METWWNGLDDQISDWWKKTWRIVDGSLSRTRSEFSSSSSRRFSEKKCSQQCTSCSSRSRWHTCSPTMDGWNAASCLWWSYQDSQTTASWSFLTLSKSDCFGFHLYSRSVPRSKTESDQCHDTQKQNNRSISSRWTSRNIHWDVLHGEDSCRQSYDESIRSWWKKGIFGDLDGNFGSWAEDEEDGAEGFLDALEDVFWIWDDND